ncbi:MAG TPA: extracellular solute-binding protein [Methylomirabilota bacterium]|jgi:iron(III) transport system substrate-binding protein|nr:extracellular solute-binding protein [Methylomirabilota bacterium]
MRRPWVFLALVAFGTLAIAEVPAAAQGKIVIYAAEDEKTTNALTKTFTEETKITTEVIRIPAAGTLATRIRSEKAAPKADIFIGGSVEFHEPLATEGLVLPYRSPVVGQARIDPVFVSPVGNWHGWFMGTLVIVLSPQRFEREIAPQGLAKPKTWDDLLHPAYRKKLVSGAPATCGGAYIFMAVQIFRNGGEGKGFDWLKRYDQQVLQYTPTCPAPITLVARGEAVAGMTWQDDATEAALNKQPIEVIFPPETGAEIGGASIIKGGPNSEGAKKFVDFLLSKRAQGIKTELGFTYPVRGDVEPPKNVPPLAEIKLVKYDRQFAIANRERLTKRWEAEIGSKR